MKRIFRNDMPQGQRDRIAMANTGRKQTEETKRKISQSMQKYWQRLPYKETPTLDAAASAMTAATASAIDEDAERVHGTPSTQRVHGTRRTHSTHSTPSTQRVQHTHSTQRTHDDDIERIMAILERRLLECMGDTGTTDGTESRKNGQPRRGTQQQ